MAETTNIAAVIANNHSIPNAVNTDLTFVSVTGAKWATLNKGKVRLEAGKYDLLMTSVFAFNVVGSRAITPHITAHTVNTQSISATDTTTRVQAAAKLTLTTATDLFLLAFQTSGAALSVSTNVQITKVGEI
ncbi:hypothetical protein [Solibacillus sp. CAU 1738]|uniref:hypothetical protein n=1 Tax=Solibacillus sp. CAU 1738 TaxID=3140363 RepID=UPI00326101C4